jgi:hypothetical protein
MGTYTKDEIGREPTKELFSHLIADAKELAVGHLGRMQGEFRDELKNLRSYMLKVAIAVAVVVVAAVLLGHTLGLALTALGMPAWVGYGIAALLLAGTGVVILKRLPGDKKDMDLVPEESMHKLSSDLRSVSHAVRH